MTIILNFIFAGMLLITGIYQLWNGNWTEGLGLFTLILILHNAAGAPGAAQNTVEIYHTMNRKFDKVSRRLDSIIRIIK